MRTLACILALVLSFGLFAVIPPTAYVAYAVRPCGHDDAAPGDHNPADCAVPGHYNCDGETHEAAQCWMGYIAGGGLPEIPGGLPEIPGIPGGIPGFPGGMTGGGNDDDPPGGGIPEIPGGGPFGGGLADDADFEQPEIPQPPSRPPVPPDYDPPSGTPVEIEIPDDGSDLDLDFDDDVLGELTRQGTWTISCRESEDRRANPYFEFTITLNFEAVRHGGEGILGEYFGVGILEIPVDASRFIGQLPMGGRVDYVTIGPIENVFIELVDAGDDDLISLVQPNNNSGPIIQSDDDDELGSLVSGGMRAPLIAISVADVIWRASMSENLYMFNTPLGPLTGSMTEFSGAMALTMWIYVYDGGRATIYIGGLPFSRNLVFYGTVSRRVNYR